MRRLMWIALGFLLACLIGVYLVSGFWLPLLGGCFLAVGAGLYFVKSEWGKRTFLWTVGFLLGLLWLWAFDGLYLETAKSYDGKTLNTTITASDYSIVSDDGTAVQGTLDLEGKTYRVCLYLDTKNELKPGDRLIGNVFLSYTVPDTGEVPSHFQGKGIFLIAFDETDLQVQASERIPWTGYPSALRKQITKVLDRLFPEDTLAFARALLLGDDSLLSYEQDRALQISGIRHVIAVSGLHVSILFALIYTLCGKQRVLTAIIGLPMLLLFSAVAGFTPSIVRASVMQGLMILALLINKEYDPPTALSFAVLVILGCNPMAITSVSFQLSVGCMVGIFLFSERIANYFLKEKSGQGKKKRDFRNRLKRWSVHSVAVTLSAMAITTPLCAYYFGMVSLVGVVTNLLTLWVISFVFYGIVAACLLGALWLPAGQVIAWLIGIPIRYVLQVANILSEVTLAAVYTDSVYIVAWLTFAYVLLFAFLRMEKKEPVALIICMALSLFAAVGMTRLESIRDPYRVAVLDVGQGQSVVLQCREKTYLVDCGGDTPEKAADTVSMYLLGRGITHLDGLILTHYDTDHAGGVGSLLSRIPAETMYLPDIYDDNGLREEIEELASGNIEWVREDVQLSFSEGMLSLYAGTQQDDDNESGLCVLFQAGNCDILITGDRGIDGEAALMESVQLPELELLVAGHHGSATSTGLELLRVTTPAAVAISVGQGNSYGHPAAETLLRLDLFGCKVYRTDQMGTIVFRG